MQLNLPRILIVDDDNRILVLLKRFLEQNRYSVSTATSVQEAEVILSTTIFDLIILDVMLPEITGIDFAKTIRSSGKIQSEGNEFQIHGHTKLPIVMLTALSSPADRLRAIEAGADEYMTKPFEPEELLIRIKNLLSKDSDDTE